jgi:hypothetical protein
MKRDRRLHRGNFGHVRQLHSSTGWPSSRGGTSNPCRNTLAAAKAMRTRVAVSVMRAATLSSRASNVANSATACG